jgi:hypothetical protein
VPACTKCNNRYSVDEVYVSCFVDYFRSVLSNHQLPLRTKTQKALQHDEKLSKLIKDSFVLRDGKIEVTFNKERIDKILLKLSLGHIANKLDDAFDLTESLYFFNVKMKPAITYEELKAFEEIPTAEITGECGSDFTHEIAVVQGVGIESDIMIPMDIGMAFILWNDVQFENYRFLAFPNVDGGYTVRIVISETLYAEAMFR